MTRSTWLLIAVVLLNACHSPDQPETKQALSLQGQWRFTDNAGDKGEDLDIDVTGMYSRTKWVADLVHYEHGHYEVQTSWYLPEGWVIFFYPTPDTINGAIWHKNPYGYRVTEHSALTLGLMISSRVNPSGSESIIGETVQLYHPRPR